MKIIHIETGRHLYGGALQVVYLLRGLKTRGVQNVLACAEGSAIAAAARDFAEVHELPMATDLDPRFGAGLWRVIRTTGPDLVHVHSRRGADIWGGAVARMAGVPVILTRRVDNPESPWLARLKYSPYEKVITISEGIRSVLLAEGMDPERLVCVHSAVDIEQYRVEGDRSWFCSEFDFDADNRVVGVIAQLIPRKGHRFLLEKAREIIAACPEARFLILGQGPLRSELETFCRQEGLEEHVRFAGFRKDLKAILPCLHLVAHPATMEGLGVSLLQACVAGVPIVAGRAGGIPEIIDHGVNGYLIEPGDSEALARYVIELLLDRDKAVAFGRSGQRIVAEKFSIERMVAGNLDVYRGIVGCPNGS